MRILGISAYYHDSAAALLRDGQVVAAAQEERFTRKKHDAAFPHQAVRACLASTGTRIDEIDFVAFYDKPFLKFERLLETYLAFAPRGFTSFRSALPVWVKDKLFQKSQIIKALKELSPKANWKEKLLFSEHHLSHAASAYYPSPFESAAVLTMDGVGEWTTTSLALGKGHDLKVMKEIHFPHSLGLLYSAFTYYTGFKVNSGEYKVMGLAPYGNPVFKEKILENLIDLKDDGSFRLNLEYFDYCTGLTMTNDKFADLFGAPARKPEDRLTQREMDLAASIQAVTEEVVLKLAAGIVKETGEKNLCLAGGVALNCVANGKLLRERYFDRMWLQPAAANRSARSQRGARKGTEITAKPSVFRNIDGASARCIPACGCEQHAATGPALGASLGGLSHSRDGNCGVSSAGTVPVGWLQPNTPLRLPAAMQAASGCSGTPRAELRALDFRTSWVETSRAAGYDGRGRGPAVY